MADLTFLPWARAGIAGALNAAAIAGTNRPKLDVGLTVSKTLDNKSVTTKQHTVSMTMLGPGDVVGLAPGIVIRTDPADGSVGVDHRLFPTVEFGDPTLPWMFSPAIENPSHQIQPWLCLVVVPDQIGILGGSDNVEPRLPGLDIRQQIALIAENGDADGAERRGDGRGRSRRSCGLRRAEG